MQSDGTRTITYLRKGAIPFSRYSCTIELRDGKVIGTQTEHQWSY